jgi:hypothetical protein
VQRCYTVLLDVTLLTDSVCFGQPFLELGVYISRCRKPKVVNMVAPRDGLHIAEARVRQPPRKHDMAVEPIRTRRDLRERHPHLESNTRLLWKDAHRSKSADGSNDLIEKRSNFRPLAAEVMLETVPRAGVRLVSVREIAAAFLTLP